MTAEFTTAGMVVRVTEHVGHGYVDPRCFYGTGERWTPGVALWPFDAEMRGYDMEIYTTFTSVPWSHLYGDEAMRVDGAA